MYVRTKIGFKAGQIEDVEPVAARQMIADGRATDPRDEDTAADRCGNGTGSFFGPASGDVAPVVNDESAAAPAPDKTKEKARKPTKQRGSNVS